MCTFVAAKRNRDHRGNGDIAGPPLIPATSPGAPQERRHVRQVQTTAMNPVIDPRGGDVEDDASSTKRRSLLSLAGSLLAEISLPKLILSWTMLFVVPGLLLGLAPLVASAWVSMVSRKITSPLLGIWPALLLVTVLGVGLFGV